MSRDLRVRSRPLAALVLPLALAAGACGGAPETVTPSPPPATTPPPDTVEASRPPDPSREGLLTPELLDADLDTVEASLFDQGKMWTFEFPPVEHFADAYGFRPDSAWFTRARLAALRIPGCSASFVSPNGLVMTNHHCAREHVSAVSREGEDLLERGFYSTSLDEERVVEDFHADQLVALLDVTDQVESRLEGMDEEERAQGREQVLEEVADAVARDHGGEAEGIQVEVISLYAGAYYSAYVFRRYENVKLVMAPELSIGFYGGDPDNFTYPRYNLDFSFFRVYDDAGEPLTPESWFRWDEDGAGPGEAIFIIGNPGSTSRLQTVAELELRRDVSDRGTLAFIRSRIEALRAFADAHPDEAERLDLVNTIFSLQNSEKAYEGQLAGLENPGVLARRLKLQEAFRDSIQSDPELRAEYGGLMEELVRLQAEKRAHAPAYGAFLALTSEDYASATLHRAYYAFQVLSARSRGAPEDALQNLLAAFREVDDQPAALDQALMAARFRDFAESYGQGTPWVQQILQGRSPEEAARAIQERSRLADSARAIPAVEDGHLQPSDPAIQVVQAYLQPFVAFQQTLSRISQREEEIGASLGRARLDVYGTAAPPDATFSLRIADGVVDSYEYNGTIAPTHTTFYGLYDRHYAFERMYEEAPEESPWALPDRWLGPPEALDLSTALNFVSTADIIGGNSGSPVVDRDLRVVGLVFDGNIESLPGDYIYLPEFNRSVAVDARGILEALDEVYDMDRLVLELTTGELVESEAEADARR